MGVAVVVSLTAFAFTWAGVALLRRWAPSLGMLDIPNGRSSHAVPTPRGGGLAIVVSVLIGVPAIALYRGVFSARIVLPYLAAGAILAAVGWMDDRRSLSPYVRLATHVVAALLVMAGMGFFADVRLPLVGSAHWGWIGLPLTLLWIVGLINAYNFMDGIDGLAAGQAVLGGVFWMIAGWQSGAGFITWLGLLIASASFGFLLHNWTPARIFMGDVASGFLGFSFAALPLMSDGGLAQESWLAMGAIVLGVFIFDTGFTFLRRLRNGERVFVAHRSHLYQRLVISGLSHARVASVYLLLSLLIMGIAVLNLLRLPFTDYLVISVMAGVAGLLLVWTRRREHLVAKRGTVEIDA